MAEDVTLERVALEAQLCSEHSMRDAKRTALRRHMHLVEVLIDEHTVDENELAEALAQRLELERVKVEHVDDEAILEIAHDVAAAHLVVPLSIHGDPRALTVAMVNPLDAEALRDVADGTSCVVQPKIATLSDVRAALPRFYSSMITRMIPRTPRAEPSTQPHLELPDERSLELRFRALVDLLTDQGVIKRADLDSVIHALTSGEDV